LTGLATAEATVVAECCFLDVAQGACSIILLGNSQAIVVDCGPRGFTPVRALQHFGVRDIVALVVSHNDADHYGGAAQVVQSFPKQIRQVYFLEDRPARRTPLLALIRREVDSGSLLTQPVRLEAHGASGSVLYRDAQRDVSLHVLFPWMLANIDARERGGANRTSAVLALQCRNRRIVFGGDLPMEGWRQVRQGLGAPLVCDVLAVPHHGGSLDGRRHHAEDYDWLYREAIRCATAVVSVGTNNRWRHPLPLHIDAVRRCGAKVMCTQVTRHCCDDLERLRPGVRSPHVPGAAKPSESRSAAGWSRHVACAGSVLVEISPDVIHVERLDEHQSAVDALCVTGGHPLCRTGTQPHSAIVA
jgi:beta-lactamase superfamily II metal-dependent hydrolase